MSRTLEPVKGRWSVSDDALRVFHRCTKAQRERMIANFDRIAEFPFNYADAQLPGEDGRLYSIAHLERWVITYWVDPDRSLLRITELEYVG